MVTQKNNPTAVSFSLLASISCSVFSHPCLPKGCHLPNKTCALLIFCVGKLQRNLIAAENKIGDNFFYSYYSSVITEPMFREKKEKVGCRVMGETIFLMGYKTFCLTSEGLLALMLILPRFYCAVRNVKHVIIPSVVSVEIFHFLNKHAVFLHPFKPLLCAAPAALP